MTVLFIINHSNLNTSHSDVPRLAQGMEHLIVEDDIVLMQGDNTCDQVAARKCASFEPLTVFTAKFQS